MNEALPLLAHSRRLRLLGWSVVGFWLATAVTLCTAIPGGVFESPVLLGVSMGSALLSPLLGVVFGALRFHVPCDSCLKPLCARVGGAWSGQGIWALATGSALGRPVRCMNCGQVYRCSRERAERS